MPEGLEPPTDGLEIRCSIQLSYGTKTSVCKDTQQTPTLQTVAAWVEGLRGSYTTLRVTLGDVSVELGKALVEKRHDSREIGSVFL